MNLFGDNGYEMWSFYQYFKKLTLPPSLKTQLLILVFHCVMLILSFNSYRRHNLRPKKCTFHHRHAFGTNKPRLFCQ